VKHALRTVSNAWSMAKSCPYDAFLSFASFPPASHAVHRSVDLSSTTSIPSVTFVRSFPRSGALFALKASVSPNPVPLSTSPLCGLCDLCAMLSQVRALLALGPTVSPNPLRSPVPPRTGGHRITGQDLWLKTSVGALARTGYD
jgi:hypothetical protein